MDIEIVEHDDPALHPMAEIQRSIHTVARALFGPLESILWEMADVIAQMNDEAAA